MPTILFIYGGGYSSIQTKGQSQFMSMLRKQAWNANIGFL